MNLKIRLANLELQNECEHIRRTFLTPPVCERDQQRALVRAVHAIHRIRNARSKPPCWRSIERIISIEAMRDRVKEWAAEPLPQEFVDGRYPVIRSFEYAAVTNTEIADRMPFSCRVEFYRKFDRQFDQAAKWWDANGRPDPDPELPEADEARLLPLFFAGTKYEGGDFGEPHEVTPEEFASYMCDHLQKLRRRELDELLQSEQRHEDGRPIYQLPSVK